MRLPIVLSDIPTNREVSRDYGVYFKLEDIDGLADALCKAACLRGTKQLSTLADRYLIDFSWEHVAKVYLDVIRNKE